MKTEWKSVSEAQPPLYERVLVADENGRCIASRTPAAWIGDGGAPVGEVRAWMELPPAPSARPCSVCGGYNCPPDTCETFVAPAEEVPLPKTPPAAPTLEERVAALERWVETEREFLQER